MSAAPRVGYLTHEDSLTTHGNGDHAYDQESIDVLKKVSEGATTPLLDEINQVAKDLGARRYERRYVSNLYC